MKHLLNKALDKGIDYKAYYELSVQQTEEETTSGENQSEALVGYTKLNTQRMKRLNKTIKINDQTVESVNSSPKQNWILLTETWCGDACQSIPVLSKMVESSENIDLKIVFRDENTELMDQFLTNGGRSIPKLIAVDENMEVLFSWGPRPEELQNIVKERKKDPEYPYSELSKEIQAWYNKNKGQNIQDEFVQLLEEVLV